MLIEIHMIQNQSPSNLNRDDFGAPKTCMFGGVPRARISSQCLKRSIRNPGDPDEVHKRNAGMFAQAMKDYIGCRTKLFPWLVREQLKVQSKLGIAEKEQIPKSEWSPVVAACTTVAQKAERESKERNGRQKTDPRDATRQLIFFGPRHAAEFVKQLAKLRGSDKKSYEYFQHPRVVFTALLEQELEWTSLDDEQRKKAAKNGWLIVKYEHRWKALNDWVDLQTETAADTDEKGPVGDGSNVPQSGDESDRRQEPGQAEAEIVAQALSEMASHAENDDDTKQLLDDLLKGKAQRGKKWGQKDKPWGEHEEEKIGDERKPPKSFEDFCKELRHATGPMAVDIALFGRMTTSWAFEDVQAAMQVAHAISTHQVFSDVDYWTAVDDKGLSQASGHLGAAVFNSACFYKYFSLDWDQLVTNLAGPAPDENKDAEAHRKWKDELKPQAERLAACTLGHFLRAAARTTPTGKQNSFASHCEPCGILVEIKKTKVPTSYANAFAEPVERIGKPEEDAADEHSLEGRSVACLADHVQSMRKAYGITSTLFWYSPKLWKFPLQYWERSSDGKKINAKLVTDQRFPVLGGEDRMPQGLVEAVVKSIGFDWLQIKDLGKAPAKES